MSTVLNLCYKAVSNQNRRNRCLQQQLVNAFKKNALIVLIDSLLMLCITCFTKQIQIPNPTMMYLEGFCHCQPLSSLLSQLSLHLSLRFHCILSPLTPSTHGQTHEICRHTSVSSLPSNSILRPLSPIRFLC